MKSIRRRAPSLVLALLLTCTLSSTASAARFSDVPAGCWYEEAAGLCAEQGVLIGTGQNAFSPEGVLSRAECLTLALRLYDLRQGGDGSLETPPEEWGKFVLTTQDGTQIAGYADTTGRFGPAEGWLFSWSSYTHSDYGYLSANLTDAQTEWGKTQEGPAILTVNGQSYSGTVTCWFPLGNWVLSFHPEDGDSSEAGQAIHSALYSGIPGPGKWWRTPLYYGITAGLSDAESSPGFARLLSSDLAAPATRLDFALALADAAGPLPALKEIQYLPDLERAGNEAIFSLYESGVLTGTDKYGTFSSESTLSRAEAAVMTARVLDPELRIAGLPAQEADPDSVSNPTLMN